MMPNCDPQDGFFFSTLTTDSYSIYTQKTVFLVLWPQCKWNKVETFSKVKAKPDRDIKAMIACQRICIISICLSMLVSDVGN